MKVVFIGAGPGDPELITVKGSRVLESADIIIYAGSLVSPEILRWCCGNPVVMDSAGMDLEQVCAVYEENRDKKGVIARVHTGDPSLYGAIQEQMDFLRSKDIPFEIIPGVSSFQAAAAALEQEYTLPGVSQSLIITRAAGRTPVPEKENLKVLARAGTTMVLFLSISLIDKAVEDLMESYSSETPAAVVYRASWPDQKIIRGKLSTLPEMVKEAGITRQALIIIGNVLKGKYELSKLYDPSFSHGWRKGRKDESSASDESGEASS